METRRISLLILVLAAVIIAIWALESMSPKHAQPAGAAAVVATSSVQTADYAQLAQKYPHAPELVHPDGYINTDPSFTLSSLVGKKVVLLDFWTYSCINCQRTLPYLEAWYQKYKDYGLEIVGVHTPEFDFEKVLSNVKEAVQKFGIRYPVVLDSEYATWDAYGNNYWPEHYLIDLNGLVRDRHIGEGDYAQTEIEIQQLLRERAQALGLNITIPSGLVDISQAINAQSPETYFGSNRNQYLGNGQQGLAGEQTLSAPQAMEPNTLYLSGTWDFLPEYAQSASADAKIFYQYDAGDVYLVAAASSTTNISLLRDGVPLEAQRGADVDAHGSAQIKDARLYHLVHESAPGVHTLEIIIHTPGLQAFTFTFG